MIKETPLNLLLLENTSIYEQLQIEEALLRADENNWCLINQGSPAAIVMGISGKADLLIDQRVFEQAPIPVIRRFSGGGTVVVDPNTLFITWICNTDFIKIPPFPDHILQWTAGLYQEVFKKIPFRLIENDYAIGNRKCGGNAQYLTKKRWLHHTSFLWDYEEKMMDYLLHPQRVPSYRKGRKHTDFICKLKDHLLDKESISKAFLSHLHDRFLISQRNLGDVSPITSIPHRQATLQIKLFT